MRTEESGQTRNGGGTPKFFFVFSGSTLALLDIYGISHPPTPRAKLARFAHFSVPITTAFVSYVAARDFLGVVSEKTGGRNDAGWTFFGAMSAPGAIVGTWCKSTVK